MYMFIWIDTSTYESYSHRSIWWIDSLGITTVSVLLLHLSIVTITLLVIILVRILLLVVVVLVRGVVLTATGALVIVICIIIWWLYLLFGWLHFLVLLLRVVAFVALPLLWRYVIRRLSRKSEGNVLFKILLNL